MQSRLLLLTSLVLACGHGSASDVGAQPAPAGTYRQAPLSRAAEEVLERGGELGDSAAERNPVVVTAETVTVWGITEVPDGSRLQMVYAAVDAVTRAELLKIVRVRVTGTDTITVSTDPGRTAVVSEMQEQVNGVMNQAGPMPHGWLRARRGDRVVLRCWARLQVPRAALTEAIRRAAEAHGAGDPRAVVDTLAAGEAKP